MAKATTTIKQSLQYPPQHAEWFAATQALFNRVAGFYFEVIQAHAGILALSNKEALTALEKLTHATQKNPHPVMALSDLVEAMPAMFRRAAIHAALGSARSFFAHRRKWQSRREKAQATGKTFRDRPPVPPRAWNKSATLYAGMWKDRQPGSILLKVWTGTCWSWLKCRLMGWALPTGTEAGSPCLVRHGKQWWLHTPAEKQFSRPPKIEKQVTTNPETKICAVDLNLDRHLAVCTVQTVVRQVQSLERGDHHIPYQSQEYESRMRSLPCPPHPLCPRTACRRVHRWRSFSPVSRLSNAGSCR
jgi:putative transposase